MSRLLRLCCVLAALTVGACTSSAPSVPRDAASAGDDAMARDAAGADAEAATDAAARADAASDASASAPPVRVVLMIGDGMGPGQLEAASRFAHGAPGALAMHALPVRGALTTGGPSGIIDSAASATAMSTGEVTENARVALDRDGRRLETLVELAHARGLATGVVTTAALPHATPAAFSAHDESRHHYVDIAAAQVRDVRPHVMLGGGARYFRAAGPGSQRPDEGLFGELAAAGYALVEDRAGLAAIDPRETARLFGAFADQHMTFARERAGDSREPTLTEMALTALEVLEAQDRGFFLMIEGARIDMASHGNDLANAIGETLAFDEAVAAVRAWASAREGVTLVVTADHECGGLEVRGSSPAGTLPDVGWRWNHHTNARVPVFAEGPLADVLHDEVRDHRWVHAVLRARVTGAPLAPPPRVAVPDGRLLDLRHEVARQAVESSFGPTHNRLDALRLDADRYGLHVGVEGLFEWSANALVVLIDVDFGAATGHATLAGALRDRDGRADAVLSASRLDAPPVEGFGADFAIVTYGGADPQLGERADDAGLRGLRPPFGRPDDLGWHAAALNFGEGVRTRAGVPASPLPGEGFEAFVPWAALYPDLGGRVPPGAELALAVVLVNSDGGFTSNQALPPFPAGTASPGRARVALPGVARFVVDADGDGVADADRAPAVLP
ncbi:MAG: alkaline phosphatase [Sandaracinaceae bacterium]|nr:alkaline phosphatase [Sandaracinaceae bacterium]